MSVRKRAGILSPNQIFELVWDSESEKQGNPAISYEEKGTFQEEPGVSYMQLGRPTCSCQASSSSISSIASNEEKVFHNGSGVKWCRVKRKVVG
jgi:hypothetical protein